MWQPHAALIPIYCNQARPVRLPLPIIPGVNATAHPFGGFGVRESRPPSILGGTEEILTVEQDDGIHAKKRPTAEAARPLPTDGEQFTYDVSKGGAWESIPRVVSRVPGLLEVNVEEVRGWTEEYRRQSRERWPIGLLLLT